MSTRPMAVENIAFLLDRLAADTPPNQQIRELTQNAIEAIQRRCAASDETPGVIHWDVDWTHLEHEAEFKLSIIDNGDGMTAEDMKSYLNSLAVQGAGRTQDITANFGVGAKITALHANRDGLVYKSWRDDVGSMVQLHRDDEKNIYGLRSFDMPDGTMHWSPHIKWKSKPKIIASSGTKVTLLGCSEQENTCLPSDGGGANWIIRYLSQRYFRLPENLKIQCRVLTKNEDEWPMEEPDASAQTFNMQTIKPSGDLLDSYASSKGEVRLSNATAHWWVFDNPADASHKMSTRGGRTGQMGIVFQNEVYIRRTPPSSRRIMAGFGIIFGAEHVVIYVEPRGAGQDVVRADTARSRVIINGEDVEEANWWEQWGVEFKEKMPPEIEAKIREIMAKTDRDPDGKLDERIKERLEKIKELLRPSRYRRDPDGALRGAGNVTGGAPRDLDEVHSSPEGPAPHRPQRGRTSTEYLADLVEVEGDPVTEVEARPPRPDVVWVSVAAGTRERDDNDDRAAWIAGDPLTDNTIKANRDFRGYRDLTAFFSNKFNSDGNEYIARKIREHVEEWMEFQLIEAVMTVRNLENGNTWDKEFIKMALSPEALTTLMMSRFLVIEKVNRSVGNEIAKPVAA